jgi:hypothetical protein
MLVCVPDQEIIDEIGEYLGFRMWNKRKSYTHLDLSIYKPRDFIDGHVITFQNIPLLVFQSKDSYCSSDYTLNLFTMKPTKASYNQTLLPKEITDKIKKCGHAVYIEDSKNRF